MHGCAERGHVVDPYQQLAVSEDIAEGHDRRDNREELALVNLLLLPRSETVHPRKDVVRHLAAAHVAGVGEGIGHHNTEPLATTLTILSIRVDQQPTARGCAERPPERGQKLKEGPEELGHGRELRSPQVGLGWRRTTAREQEVLGPRAGDEGLGSSPSYPSPGGLQDPAKLPLNDLS
jgi:hypothetical protein